MPDPILVGRNADKIEALAKATRHRALDAPTSTPRWRTRTTPVYFDAAHDADCGRSCSQGAIARRQARLLREAHRYQPRRRRVELYARGARRRGVKHGVVQDKLWLPGLLKLEEAASTPASSAASCRVRGEFGYWVFEGDLAAGPAAVVELPQGGRRRHHPRHAVPLALRARQPVRRGAGGVAASAPPTSRSAGTKSGKPYKATADDAAYATFELAGGVDRALQFVVGMCACAATIC